MTVHKAEFKFLSCFEAFLVSTMTRGSKEKLHSTSQQTIPLYSNASLKFIIIMEANETPNFHKKMEESMRYSDQ